MKIHQWVPAAHRGDAIGDSARRVRDLLRAMGHESDLFALTIDDDMRDEARPFADPGAAQGGCHDLPFRAALADVRGVCVASGGRVLQYHNVTPARFFARYDPGALPARGARPDASWRRWPATSTWRSATPNTTGGSSRSSGSRADRRDAHCREHRPAHGGPARARRSTRFSTTASSISSSSGRIAPNKRIEDHIRLAETYKRYVDAYYRFIFVGRHDGVPRYYAQIRALMAEYRMLPDRFWFTGPVPDEDLAAYYRASSVYISLSDHEGFCVPLVEAMATDVPVLAYSAGAVPDTLGGAGCPVRAQRPRISRRSCWAARIRWTRPRRRPRGAAPPSARFRRPRDPQRLVVTRAAFLTLHVKIAFIVQRYGTEILGGSEYHVPAHRRTARGRSHEVEVLTTCAHDYITWKNEYPEGADRIRGVTVRRFANAQHARHRGLQPLLGLDLQQRRTRRDDEMEWLKQQGPWCPGAARLPEAEPAAVRRADLLSPTCTRRPCSGIQIAPAQEHSRADGARRAGDPSRDLQGAVQRARRHRRSTPRSSGSFVTDALLDPRAVEETVGCGVDLPQHRRIRGRRDDDGRARGRDDPGRPDSGEAPPTSSRCQLARTWRAAPVQPPASRCTGRFALYGGRIDPGKGCEELIEYFSTYVQDGGDASLVLMGVKLMPLPEEPFIILRACCPTASGCRRSRPRRSSSCPRRTRACRCSRWRRFAVGTPILANARSEVLVDHCLRSNAGLFYADRDEFVEGLKAAGGRRTACAQPWAATAASTCGRTTAGT